MKGLRREPGILKLIALIPLFVAPVAGIPTSTNGAISLPVEVVGKAGTTVSVTVQVPAGFGKQARSLWMQVHGIAFGGMVSVRVNQSEWWPLNNDTVTVAGPGKNYGGIGGGFATLKMTLPLPANYVVDGANTIQYRFNRTDGVVSGFRVLAFNFLTTDGLTILPPDAFVEEDPNTWVPPLTDPVNVSAGRNLWETAQLTANSLPEAPPIHAHCSDCHAQDGRDLKYFNFSNPSIEARARFHGLSELQARQIASYIRSLPLPNPGRPWNPPYQPGPGVGSQSIDRWSAGAGIEWALDNDLATLPFLLAQKGQKKGSVAAPPVFSPDSELDPRQIPIAFQLPDWNHWLPRIHPLDFREERFRGSEFSQLYQKSARLIKAGDAPAFFEKWIQSRNAFLSPHPGAGSNKWTPEMADAFYSAQLWQLVKTWEINQKFHLEGGEGEPRFWQNAVPAATAPAEAGIPNGASGMGRSALTNEYFNNVWYEVQVLVNSGNHRHHGRTPIDWLYLAGHFLDLQQLSDRPEPGRLLVVIVKAMQSTDPAIGPTNYADGWRPERSIDPRILVSKEWEPVFMSIPAGMKQALTESLLSSWLDKTLQYPLVSYFALGTHPVIYPLPARLQSISGGRVWEAERRFQSAGVSRAQIERLDAWGKAYAALAELYHY